MFPLIIVVSINNNLTGLGRWSYWFILLVGIQSLKQNVSFSSLHIEFEFQASKQLSIKLICRNLTEYHQPEK